MNSDCDYFERTDTMFREFKTEGVIHSKNDLGEITVKDKVGDNDYIVETEDGITCHAIFNFFVGRYYADDLYTKVEKTTEITGQTSDCD